MNAAAGQPESVLQQSGVHAAPNAGYCCAIKPVWAIHQFFSVSKQNCLYNNRHSRIIRCACQLFYEHLPLYQAAFYSRYSI